MAEDNGHISLQVDYEEKQEVEGQSSNGTSSPNAFMLSPQPGTPMTVNPKDEMLSPKKLPENSNTKAKIQKAHFILRGKRNRENFFEPKVVSFGPIYYNTKSDYEKADAFKKKWKEEFLRKSSQDEEVLLGRIEKDIEELKSCYEDGLFEINDNDLARMLLVDGCAVLHYMDCCNMKEKQKLQQLNIKPNIVECVKHDMFLLENQLPFRLLDLLISESTQGKEEWKKKIKQFICGLRITLKMEENGKLSIDNKEWKERIKEFICGLCNTSEKQEKRELSIDAKDGNQKPAHLLELLRESLLRPPDEKSNGKEEKQGCCCFGNGDQDSEKEEKERDWGLFRSVTELQDSGINFKKNPSRYLEDIAFEQHWTKGTLKLPPVTVDRCTQHIFMNLVAYEMCADYENGLEVTTYICLLDTLIDCWKDVKELRKAHVVRNFLGSDDELAKLFNEIATDLVPNSELYKEIMNKIQNYYDTEWRTNMAKFYNSHFKYPWSTIALCAALIVFAMTVGQFYCAFNDCKEA